MAAKLLDGKKVAEGLKARLKEEVAGLKEKGVAPSLAAVQVGENRASAVYIRNQRASCEEIGIAYALHELPASSSQDEVVAQVKKLNDDDSVTGMILQMPLPEGMDAREVQVEIRPEKDVEGMHPSNMGMLVYGKMDLAPCTALGAMELLRSSGVEMKGKEVVVVGHSEIVGKPLTLMLLASQMGSPTPTVCHIATRDVALHTRRADILFVAAGKAGLISGDMIKEGAIVIDIGINRVPVLDADGKPVLNDKGKPKRKTVGDVVFEEAVERASMISPVPGGVGPLTTTMLLRNTVVAARQARGGQ